MKRQGILAAGLIGSAASVCVMLNQHLHLGAAEEGRKSFREALKGAPEPQLVQEEDGIRLNYFDATWDRVLKNLAEASELTLVMEKVPPGRFARRDRTRYDISSAVRILNSELEPLGYRLLNQNGFLIVLNLDQARTEYARPRLNADSAKSRSPVTREFVRNASASRSTEEPEADDSEVEETAVPLRSSSSKQSGRPSSKVRPISGTRQDPVADPAEASAPLKKESKELQQGNASDVARTLFVVLLYGAELE